ncbi:hypothetical protein ACFWF7_31395 [Nocardia sp. NPDC060256]|uniref:hypothetical protein n=1 Tax=unclassified Nocardia TaxID=2637762 RepID=UPI00365B9352
MSTSAGSARPSDDSGSVAASKAEAVFEAGFFGPDTPARTDRRGRTTFEWIPAA